MTSRQERPAAVLLGPPGSGKSTLINHLQPANRAGIIKTGELFRNEIARRSPLGLRLKPIIDSGGLAPSPLVYAVVKDALASMDADVFLFDGFPRCEGQIDALFELGRETGFHLALVVILHIDRETVLERLAGRQSCPNCGALYNQNLLPPAREGLCDRCGARLRYRSDDTQEAVTKRLEAYHRQTRPVIRFFKARFPEITIEVPSARPAREIAASLSPLFQQIGFEVGRERAQGQTAAG